MTMISNPDNLKAYLNTREASKYLRLSPRTLQNMRVSGEGPIYRPTWQKGVLSSIRSYRMVRCP